MNEWEFIPVDSKVFLSLRSFAYCSAISFFVLLQVYSVNSRLFRWWPSDDPAFAGIVGLVLSSVGVGAAVSYALMSMRIAASAKRLRDPSYREMLRQLGVK